LPTSSRSAVAPVAFKPFEERGLKGMIGPFGQVQVFTVGDQVLPVKVVTSDRSAMLDFTGRSPLVRYGSGASAVELGTQGVRFPGSPPLPWNPATVRKLIEALATDRKLAASAMLLRSALYTAYPAALSQARLPRKSPVGAAMKRGAPGYGLGSLNCTSQTVTDTETEYITERVEVITTAVEQWQACYDRQVDRDPCKAMVFAEARALCAAGICGLETFRDVVTGFIEVVMAIATEVVREVVACRLPRPGEWPNPWALGKIDLQGAVEQPPAPAFSPATLKDARALVKSIGGFLGPFGTCLLAGTWSLTQIDTHIDIGGGRAVVPYGVRVCMGADCANQLSADQIVGETIAAWGAALAALAALSPAFAAATGIAPAAVVVAGVAAAGATTAVVAAAALILGFIILALIYGTAIAGQLQIHKWAGSFSDGRVCIEHPTFALALVKLATLTLVPAELVPPIVTG
jgi:hypothetical protein